MKLLQILSSFFVTPKKNVLEGEVYLAKDEIEILTIDICLDGGLEVVWEKPNSEGFKKYERIAELLDGLEEAAYKVKFAWVKNMLPEFVY